MPSGSTNGMAPGQAPQIALQRQLLNYHILSTPLQAMRRTTSPTARHALLRNSYSHVYSGRKRQGLHLLVARQPADTRDAGARHGAAHSAAGRQAVVRRCALPGAADGQGAAERGRGRVREEGAGKGTDREEQ